MPSHRPLARSHGKPGFVICSALRIAVHRARPAPLTAVRANARRGTHTACAQLLRRERVGRELLGRPCSLVVRPGAVRRVQRLEQRAGRDHRSAPATAEKRPQRRSPLGPRHAPFLERKAVGSVDVGNHELAWPRQQCTQTGAPVNVNNVAGRKPVRRGCGDDGATPAHAERGRARTGARTPRAKAPECQTRRRLRTEGCGSHP